ncbi:hypothetical protein CWI36_1004p0010 [Hamiltosporidium magnivora]|uniref:Uncharacterized protein n=1 Tax=Hamiltosporidium magnivora TaxID=148818 RepID=A0A4Q9L5Y0_9MICR|nr:hypothetical protein CWI36_1004p0010 [Hamiltosporidium magnivora]
MFHILYSQIFCITIGRKVIFRQIFNPHKTEEHINSTETLIYTVESNILKFNINEKHFERDSKVLLDFCDSKDIIIAIIFDIEKFALNFKKIEDSDASINSENSIKVLKVETFAIKKFELFLSTYYLHQKNISIKDYLNFIYFFEVIGVEFDDKYFKTVETLAASLLSVENFDSSDFEEKINNVFTIDLISRESSFFVFKTTFDFLFEDFKFKNFERFYGSNHLNLPNLIRERFITRYCNTLYLNEFSLPIYFDEGKYSKIQRNIIYLILYILNYKDIEIRFSFINNHSSLYFLLSLLISPIEDVIFNKCEINNSLINFLNKCAFFKKVKNIFILNAKICDGFEHKTIDLLNLESLTILEPQVSKITTMMCNDITEKLKIATENEIKERVFPEIETQAVDAGKCYKMDSEKYYRLIPSNKSSSTVLNIYLSSIYEHFIYKISGVILNDKLVDIFYLGINNI